MALSQGQIRVLEALKTGAKPVSNFTNGAVVAGQAVTSLERVGLVTRKTDKNGSKAAITPEGRKALKAATTPVRVKPKGKK